MAVRIGDTLKQINNADFPIVEAMDVAFESGDTLQELYDSGALSGGGGGTSYIELSEEEYLALSDEERASEVEYRTYDTGRIFKRGVEFGKETDISSKQDNLSQVKFTMRRNSVNEPRYCMIASSDLSQNLLMCEPYRFKGIFGSSTESVEKKSLIDLYVSFREGAIADKVMKGYADSREAFDYVDLIITVDEETNRSYAYVDFLTSGSMCSGEITVPVLDAEKYMTFAESFELVDSMIGVELCRMSDYCKVITEIDDENDPSENTVWSSKKTSDEIDALISDTSSTTSTYSSKKIDKKFAPRHFGTDNKTLWLKLQLGNMTTHEPIIVTDQYGGQVKILGMYDLSTYKSVKVIRLSYGDWSTHSGTDVSTTTSGDGNYKIRRLFYCPDDNNYYLEIRQYAYISVEGAPDATVVASLPVEESEMTLIPESKYASISDTSTSETSTWSSSKIASTMPTTRSLTLNSGYNGYITEVYDPTTKVVVYNVNINGTFKGLGNAIATGFKIPKDATSSADVMHTTLGIYGAINVSTGDAQFTRLLIRSYDNPFLDVDIQGDYIINGTITYVTT